MPDLDKARLDWIDKNHYSRGQTVDVVEEDEAGRGYLRFILQEGETALRFKLSEKGRFPCIAQRKAADGVVLQFSAGKKLQAIHLVELKSKLSISEWTKVKLQLQGALHNAHALLGVLGLNWPDKVICHTAYKQDAVSTNPALMKQPMGQHLAQIDGADWVEGKIAIDQRFSRLEHHRHQRDASGNAEVIL